MQAIEAILSQTFRDFELVISDNGSTDETESICSRFAREDPRVRYCRSQENRGAAWNFNRLVELARGEYFKWAAHDDLLDREYLRHCVERMQQRLADTVLVFPRRHAVNADGVLARRNWASSEDFDDISFARFLRLPGGDCPIFVFGLVRTEVLRKTRLIQPFKSADLVVVAELRLLGRFAEAPEAIFLQRKHMKQPKDRKSIGAELTWYLPTVGGSVLANLPPLNLFVEYLKVVARSPSPPGGKLAAYGAVLVLLVAAPVRFGRLRFVRAAWEVWAWLTASAARVSTRTSVPLRMWAPAAGVQALDGKLVRTAVGPPFLRPKRELLEFAAARLRRRRDRGALRTLEGWRASSSDEARLAATKVSADQE